VNFSFAPVHPVLAVNFGGNETAIRKPGHDAGRLVVEMLIFFPHQRGAMLLPVNQISGGCDSNIGVAPVPLCVGQNISAIFAFHQARIFHTTRPFLVLL